MSIPPEKAEVREPEATTAQEGAFVPEAPLDSVANSSSPTEAADSSTPPPVTPKPRRRRGKTPQEVPPPAAPRNRTPKRQAREVSLSSEDSETTSAIGDASPLAPRPKPSRKPKNADAPEAVAESLPSPPSAEESPAPGPRSRRGKRGGRTRGRKAPTPEPTIRLPLQIVEAITALLALPPGRAGIKKAKTPRPVPDQKTGRKQMLISVRPLEQIEVAIAEEGQLLEYYLDMLHQRKIKGNIYKGIIHNIDTNLQAAFVDYGAGKNGFLQIDQVHPEYWQSVQETERGRRFPPIQKILKIGQEVLVQVVKEPAGSKGAFLTTWLSLAGRFLVLTPGQEQIGVSRKVSEPEERRRLRDMMNGIDPGKGFGVIVRTVGEGANKTTLKSDLQYLKRLWREIRKRATEVSAPAIIHQEPGLPERSVRDYLTEDVGAIWVDDEQEAEHVRNMVSLLYPRKQDLVHLYTDQRHSLWDKFGLRRQLDQIYDREVLLPSGGRLVFDQTEALMAIDINSGRISGKGNFEQMAFKTNMEAAEAIARQLRLRDIGGQVVIDFIEMRDKSHVVEVEKCLRHAMKADRAKHDVARMSGFGLLELVRQRMGSSALSICLETCPMCGGTGLRRNLEWHAQRCLGELRQKLVHHAGEKFTYELPRELGMYLLNTKRDALRRLEEEMGKTLEINISL